MMGAIVLQMSLNFILIFKCDGTKPEMSISAGTSCHVYIYLLNFCSINIFLMGVFPQHHCIAIVVPKVVATDVSLCGKLVTQR